ncbi:MAG: LamG domain-containing protein, partial [Cytophagales bacterium]
MKKLFLSIAILISTLNCITAQDGPGGVGSRNGTSALKVWLDASDRITIVTNTGNALVGWDDKSGSANHAATTSGTNVYGTGTYQANVFNGNPAIAFNGGAIANESMSTSGGYTPDVFMAIRVNTYASDGLTFTANATNGYHQGTYLAGSGNYGCINSGGSVLGSRPFPLGQLGVVNVFYGRNLGAGQSLLAINGSQSTFTIAAADYGAAELNSYWLGKYNTGGHFQNCNISEVLVYNSKRNNTQRLILENYLASKYDIGALATDLYLGDTPGNGNYDLAVIGTGQQGASDNHTIAYSDGGLNITVTSSVTTGAYLFAGHNKAVNTVSSVNLSGLIQQRWDRDFYVDKTGNLNAGNTKISFNFLKSGISTTPGLAANYTLIYRSTSGGTFSEVTVANAAVVGNEVVFDVADANLVDGYYTIGTKNTLFSGLGSQSNAYDGPGGVGSRNGASALRLWLDASTGTNTSVNGVGVSSWTDQSGNGSNALQASVGNQPTFVSNSVNGKPALSFNGTSSYLLVNPFQLFATRSSPITSFLVFNPTDISSQRFLMFQWENNNCVTNFELGYRTGSGSTPNWGLHNGCSNAAVSENAATSSNNIMTLKILSSGTSPSNVQMRKNGSDLSITNNAGGWTNAGNYQISSSDLYIGSRLASNGWHQGTIAEIISYNTTLNATQTNLVENYLNAKYNISIANDKYAQPTTTTYINGVFGIGQESVIDNQNIASSKGGLSFAATPSLTNGAYLIAGYENNTNTVSSANLSGLVLQRWDRDFFIDKTGSLSAGNTSIAFDFALGGLTTTPGAVADYTLLYRTTSTGTFSEVTVSAKIVQGTQVIFDVTDANLVDGYYTIGTKNISLSGLEVQANNALQFNGNGTTGPFVTVNSNSNDFNLGNNFTMEAWVNPLNLNNRHHTIFSKGEVNGAFDNGYALQINTFGGINQTLHFFNALSSGTAYWINSGIVVPYNTWSHVAVTYNGSTSILGFYFNGVNVTNVGYNLNLNVTGGLNDFFIGRQGYGCQCHKFNGQIDEARIWNVARTPNDIRENIYRTINGNLPGLVAAYNFNQGIGGGNNTGVTTLIDQAGGNHNGTLNSFTNLAGGTTSNWVGSITTTTGLYNFGAPFINMGTAPSVCANGTGTYTITATGQGSFNYQWHRNGNIISGQTSATLNLTSALTTSVGTYLVQVSSIYGTSTSVGVMFPNCNNALDFDGGNDEIVVGNISQLNLTSNFTAEAWVYNRLNTTGTDFLNTIFSKKTGGGPSGWALFVNEFGTTNGRLVFETTNGNFLVSTNINSVPVGQWSHVAVSVNQGVVSMYINGVLVPSTWTGSFSAVSSTVTFRIGNFEGASFFNNGIIDEARIWNISLSQQEIQNNLYKNISTTTTGLVGYWDFNQGIPAGNNTTITSIIDKSGNGSNGAFSGFTLNGGASNFISSAQTTIIGTYTFSAPTITGITSSQTVCSGVTIPLSVTATGSGLGYQWFKNGVSIAGATASTVTLTSALTTSAGIYTVAITSLGGNLTSSGINIGVGCNNALQFAGDNDNVSFPINFSGAPSNQITLEAWVNPNNITTNRFYEIFRADGVTGNGFLFSFQEFGTVLSFGTS